MEKVKSDIKNRQFERVYLFFGDEHYLKKTYVEKLQKVVMPKEAEMMNLDVFQEKKLESSKISDACETFPFMNEFRLVIVKDSELFIQGSKEQSEKLADFIKDIPETTILVFIEEKVDKRSKLYKSIVNNGYCVECKSLKEKEMIEWIKKIISKKKLSMSNDTLSYFVRTINNGMEAALIEIEKLSDYIKEGEVNKKNIDDICTKSLEVKIFDLVAAIGEKKPQVALDIYNNMVLMKESPIMILTMIARQFRIIIQSKYLAETGLYKSDIAKKIGQREFVINECLSQAKNFKKKVLLKALEDCLICDNNIKTGKVEEKIGVEMIIMKYSSNLV